MSWWYLIIAIFAFHQLLSWLYFWQIKEYRWDRFWDALKNGEIFWLLKQYDIRRWYRPKMTLRAIFSLLLGLVLICFLKWWWLLVAPLLVAVIVLGSGPVFEIQKRRIIGKAKRKMEKFCGVVIGVTGSYGKSSTKEILVGLLKEKYKVAYTKDNLNSEMGVALSVLSWKGDEEVAVVEMGAYKRGEIRAICEMVKPEIGIITGLGDQHLSLFGSLENLKKAKYELIDSLPKEGKAFVAGKEFSVNELKRRKVEVDGFSFEYEGEEYKTKLLGAGQMSNVLAAIKVALYLKMTRKEIKKALLGLDRDKFWPKMYEVNENLVVIDNSYNASKESFLSLIDYLESWKGYSKIIVSPGMIELGKNSKKDHKEIGERLEKINKFFLTKRNYFEELNKYGQVEVVTKNEDLLARLREEVSKGKVVLAFKSRVSRKLIDQIIKNEF